MTIEDFKSRAFDIHGNKYNYSLVNITNNKTPIDILCSKHGIFNQNIYKHLLGQGCPKCMYDSKRLTKDEFIKKSNIRHNNKYNYDNVVYKNNITNVDIICPIHGKFEQTPSNHLSGYGCQKCGGSEKSNKQDFIDKSNKIHNNRYDYSLVEYYDNKTGVNIICNIHGSFTQSPSNHLKGHGCPACSNLKRLDTNSFIEKSNKVHNNKYNYDNVNYINHKSTVDIVCNKHGLFKQVAGYHLSGNGCPICNSSKGEIEIENFLKENNIKYKSQFTFNNLKHKGILKFDFGLFYNDKLVCLVEFNGEQHYKFKINFHKSIEGFEIYKYRDELKYEYCKLNKIPLIIIRYDDNIKSIMNIVKNKYRL